MDTYLPPPDSSTNSTIQLTHVLDKLNSKIDLFNYNVNRLNAAPPPPPPPPPKIPVKFLCFFVLVGLILFKFNRVSPTRVPVV